MESNKTPIEVMRNIATNIAVFGKNNTLRQSPVYYYMVCYLNEYCKEHDIVSELTYFINNLYNDGNLCRYTSRDDVTYSLFNKGDYVVKRTLTLFPDYQKYINVNYSRMEEDYVCPPLDDNTPKVTLDFHIVIDDQYDQEENYSKLIDKLRLLITHEKTMLSKEEVYRFSNLDTDSRIIDDNGMFVCSRFASGFNKLNLLKEKLWDSNDGFGVTEPWDSLEMLAVGGMIVDENDVRYMDSLIQAAVNIGHIHQLLQHQLLEDRHSIAKLKSFTGLIE